MDKKRFYESWVNKVCKSSMICCNILQQIVDHFRFTWGRLHGLIPKQTFKRKYSCDNPWRKFRQHDEIYFEALPYRGFNSGKQSSTYHSLYPTLQWRHNGHDSVSIYQPHDCLLNGLFRCRSKKTKLRATSLCDGNSPETGDSPHKGPVTRNMFPFDDDIMSALRHRAVSSHAIDCVRYVYEAFWETESLCTAMMP